MLFLKKVKKNYHNFIHIKNKKIFTSGPLLYKIFIKFIIKKVKNIINKFAVKSHI